MTFNIGTATSYTTLLDQLVQVMTSRHLQTIAINAAGTGYVAGNILGITNTGSTNTHVAQIEVLTIGGGGSIATARIYTGGAYTVDPTTVVANAATGGAGAGATFNISFADTGWVQQRRTKVAASAVIGAGGTGYSIGNVLTLQGGVLGSGGSAATFTVATLAGSAVATVTLLSAGQYEVPPSNAAITTVAPAGGTGATLTVTYANKTGDTVVVLVGDGGGANIDPVVAIKSYTGLDEGGTNVTSNWALFMATAYSALLPVHQLVNISPGFNTTLGDGSISASTTGDGAFVPLKAVDAFNIDWWISATGRRVHVVAKVRGASTTYYSSCSFGLLNPFGITTEMPYPAYVLGASDRTKVWYRDTLALFGGLSDVISRNNGPGFVWAAEGAWLKHNGAEISTNTSLAPSYTAPLSSAPHVFLWPIGYPSEHPIAEDHTWDQQSGTMFDNSMITNTTPVRIYRTPDTGGDLFPLFPLTFIQSDAATAFHRTFGEIDGAYWFDLGGTAAASEDRFMQSGVAYRIFQSGTRVQPHSFFCLRED